VLVLKEYVVEKLDETARARYLAQFQLD